MARSRVDEATFSKASFVTIPSLDGYLKPVTVYGKSTQASTPTPDVPVAITSTTGNVAVRSDSKNLVTVTRSSFTSAGIAFTNNGDGTITMNGTASGNAIYVTNASVAAYIRIIAGTVYYVTGLPTTGSAGTYYIEAQTFNDDGTSSYNGTFSTSGGSFTAAKTGLAYFYIAIKTGFVASNLVVKPQLEVSAVATTFEKQTTSTQTLPLATTQLRSLPNGVSDRIYKSGSSWFLERNVASQVLSGTENWVVTTSTGSPTYTYAYATAYDTTLPAVNTNSSSVMSSTMNIVGALVVSTPGIVADSIVVGATASYAKLRAYILTSRLATNDNAGVRAWFAANPSTIQYALRTPTTTTITDPTLITALENIRTYQGITNITASTPVSGVYLPNSLRTAATNRLTAVGRQIATTRSAA